MAVTGVKIKGADQLIKELNLLEKRYSNEIVRKALSPISMEMASVAKSNTNVFKHPTGRIRESIKTRNRLKKKGAFYVADVGIDMGAKRGDESGAYYAHMVEFGHMVRWGKNKPFVGKVPPQPFWEPAFEQVYGSSGQKGLARAQNAILAGLIRRWRIGMPRETK